MATSTRNSRFTFGIEEEFFLVHARSGRVASRVSGRFLRRLRSTLGNAVTHELLQSQIEIVSPVLDDPRTAAESMHELRRMTARIAQENGLAIVAAGTHPLAMWMAQAPTPKPRYDQLIEDFGIIGRRNAVCGMHVHVAVPPHVDRVDLMNRAMRWLPLFLALTTSSPFWNRQCTGLLSYRQSAYDEWPRSGIPDFFADEPEYRRFVGFMQRAGALSDATFLWWVIRPSERFPTLELRIADACTRLTDTLAIAALFRCLVSLLVRRPELYAARYAQTRPIIEENRWRAKRHGIDAWFIDDRSGDVVPVPQVLASLLELAAEDIERFGCRSALQRLDETLAKGTSAHRQLEIYAAGRAAGASHLAALRRVADWLASTTME